MNIREQSKGRTPGVQVAMGPLSLVQFVYTQNDSIVRSPNFGSCTDPHSKYTKYRLLLIVQQGPMNYRDRSESRTHGVQRATVHPSLVQFVYTQPNTAVGRSPRPSEHA